MIKTFLSIVDTGNRIFEIEIHYFQQNIFLVKLDDFCSMESLMNAICCLIAADKALNLKQDIQKCDLYVLKEFLESTSHLNRRGNLIRFVTEAVYHKSLEDQ